MSTPPEKVRIDKWLWAIRVYRTRTLATEACKAGHVKIGGKAVKPARFVVPGEVVTATVGPITRMVKAVVMLERRVGAKVLDQYIEDLTPKEEYQRLKERSGAHIVQATGRVALLLRKARKPKAHLSNLLREL